MFKMVDSDFISICNQIISNYRKRIEERMETLRLNDRLYHLADNLTRKKFLNDNHEFNLKILISILNLNICGLIHQLQCGSFVSNIF